MAELITPAMLVNFGGRNTNSRHNNIPTMFLGKTNMLIISTGASGILGLDDSDENHIILQEENDKLYIKKSQSLVSGAWKVHRYKRNGLRIPKTSLCRFLRNRFSIENSEKTRFVLVEAGELGFEITKPSNKVREEVDNG